MTVKNTFLRCPDVPAPSRRNSGWKRPSLLTLVQEIRRLRAYSATLQEQNRVLAVANARLSDLATRDGLTGLVNRRTFAESLETEVQRACRYHQSLSVVMLDVDLFKQFNDTYGHVAGDQALQILAGLLEQEARDSDLVARYGGEEFALLLPHTDAQAAHAVAERLRARIESHVWPLSNLTVSIGLSTLTCLIASPWTLVEEADQALYQSKRMGRNRVTHLDSVRGSSEGETKVL